jgi:hypothetical protein
MKKQPDNDNPTQRFVDEGYKAFSKVEQRNGKYHQVANKLKNNTTPHREWQRGWNTAYFDNLEKLNGPRTRG